MENKINQKIKIMIGVILSLFLTACINNGELSYLKKVKERYIKNQKQNTQEQKIRNRPEGLQEINQTFAKRENTLPETYIEYGTGKFINQMQPKKKPGVIPVRDDTIHLNFSEAPIQEVLRVIFGDILGELYTIHPNVKTRITLSTTRPIAKSNLFETLESILDSHDIVMERRGDIVHVIPRSLATSKGIKNHATIDAKDTGFAVQLVPLRYASAKEMKELLIKFTNTTTNTIKSNEKRNMLIISGSGQQRRLIIELINIFDTNILDGMSFALFPVTSASLTEFIQELNEVFLQKSKTEISENVIRFIPIKRLNAILAITQYPNYIKRAKTWIERLDQGEIGDHTRLFVYYVQYGDSDKLANILRQIFGQNGNTKSNMSNSLATSKKSTLRSDGQDTVTPIAQAGSIGSLSIGEFAGQNEFNLSGQVKIISDQSNNALFILTSQKNYSLIKTAIEHLDIRPQQVLVEAIIAEVRLTDELQYGVQWFFESRNNQVIFANSPVTTTTTETGATINGGPAQAFPGFSYALTKTGIRAVFNALQGVTDVKVLSSPQLMVVNNGTATMTVGSQVPISTQSATNVAGSNSSIINSVELKDTGITLEVTPRVSSNGSILLEIKQEVSNAIQTTTSGIDSPTIDKRAISSTVIVDDNQSIVLAGLIRESATKNTTAVPILSKIPLLGEVFKDQITTKEQFELIILISPKIVRSKDDANAVTQELQERMRGLYDFLDRKDIPLVSTEKGVPSISSGSEPAAADSLVNTNKIEKK